MCLSLSQSLNPVELPHWAPCIRSMMGLDLTQPSTFSEAHGLKMWWQGGRSRVLVPPLERAECPLTGSWSTSIGEKAWEKLSLSLGLQGPSSGITMNLGMRGAACVCGSEWVRVRGKKNPAQGLCLNPGSPIRCCVSPKWSSAAFLGFSLFAWMRPKRFNLMSVWTKLFSSPST